MLIGFCLVLSISIVCGIRRLSNDARVCEKLGGQYNILTNCELP